MARNNFETSNSSKRSAAADGGSSLSPGKKKVAIAAAVALISSLGFVGWYVMTSDSGYQEIAAAPPETSLLSITNTTNSEATVKIISTAEATAPIGFKGDGGAVKNPLQVELEAQQGDQFVFSDSALRATDTPIEIEIEANVGGTTLKATFMFARKARVYINLYDAAGPVTFDAGPGVTMK